MKYFLFGFLTLAVILFIIPSNAYAETNSAVDYDLINSLIDSGENEKAFSYAETILENHPKDSDALFYKGYVLDEIGKYELALIYYNKALLLNPSDLDILFNKAITLENLEKYERAIDYYDKILEINPQDEDAISSKHNVINRDGLDILVKSNFDYETEYFNYSPLSMTILIPDEENSNLYVSDDFGFAFRFPESIEKWTIEKDRNDSKIDFKKKHSNTTIQMSYFEDDMAILLSEQIPKLNKNQKIKFFEEFVSEILSFSDVDVEIAGIIIEEFLDGSRSTIVYKTTDEKHNSAVAMSTFLIYNEGKIFLFDFKGNFLKDLGETGLVDIFSSFYQGNTDIINRRILDSSGEYYSDSEFLFSITPPKGWTAQKTIEGYTLEDWSMHIIFTGYDEKFIGVIPPTMTLFYKDTDTDIKFENFSDQELIDRELEESSKDSSYLNRDEFYILSEKLERFDIFVTISLVETLESDQVIKTEYML